jgi:hypothetical protein
LTSVHVAHTSERKAHLRRSQCCIQHSRTKALVSSGHHYSLVPAPMPRGLTALACIDHNPVPAESPSRWASVRKTLLSTPSEQINVQKILPQCNPYGDACWDHNCPASACLHMTMHVPAWCPDLQAAMAALLCMCHQAHLLCQGLC